MTNLHLDNKEPEEEVVRESCRVITSRLYKEAFCVVDMSTDSEEDLCFPEEGPSTVNKAMKKSHPKLGSDSEDSVEGVAEIQLRSGRQIDQC